MSLFNRTKTDSARQNTLLLFSSSLLLRLSSGSPRQLSLDFENFWGYYPAQLFQLGSFLWTLNFFKNFWGSHVTCPRGSPSSLGTGRTISFFGRTDSVSSIDQSELRTFEGRIPSRKPVFVPQRYKYFHFFHSR